MGYILSSTERREPEYRIRDELVSPPIINIGPVLAPSHGDTRPLLHLC